MLKDKQRMIRELRDLPLTAQQKRTLKGQILAGNLEGARKGIEKLLEKQNGINAEQLQVGYTPRSSKKACQTREKTEKV